MISLILSRKQKKQQKNMNKKQKENWIEIMIMQSEKKQDIKIIKSKNPS